MSSKKLKKRVSKELDRETDPAKKRELLLRHVRRRDLVRALAATETPNTDETGEKLHERRGNFLMGSFLTVITALVAWSTLADCISAQFGQWSNFAFLRICLGLIWVWGFVGIAVMAVMDGWSVIDALGLYARLWVFGDDWPSRIN